MADIKSRAKKTQNPAKIPMWKDFALIDRVAWVSGRTSLGVRTIQPAQGIFAYTGHTLRKPLPISDVEVLPPFSKGGVRRPIERS